MPSSKEYSNLTNTSKQDSEFRERLDHVFGAIDNKDNKILKV